MGLCPGLFEGTLREQSAVDGVRAICKAGLSLKVRARVRLDYAKWVEGDYSYIDKVVAYGVHAIDLGFAGVVSVGSGSAKGDAEHLEKAVAETLEYIQHLGLTTGVSSFYIGQGNLAQMVTLMNFCLDYGADRFLLGDHLGEVGPEGARYVVQYLKKGLKRDTPILYHGHNAFGLSTASTLAAVSAGAWPETVVNGFGDGRGIACFEEVVMALETLYGVKTGVKLAGLTRLSEGVEQITGVKKYALKPIVGDAIWAPDAGFQYLRLAKGEDSSAALLSPFQPQMVGASFNMNWSVNVLYPETVRAKLEQLGLNHSDQDVARIVSVIGSRLAAIKTYPAWISDSEVESICSEQCKKETRLK